MEPPSGTPPSQRPRPESALVDRMRRWGIVAWSAIGIVVVFAVGVWALMQVEDVFPPLVLALVVIYLLNPLVSRLERVGVGRLLGSCVSYMLLFAAVALAITFLIPSLVAQGEDFVTDFPRTVERVGDIADRVSGDINDRFGIEVNVGDWVGERSDLLRNALGAVGGFLRGAAHAVALLVIGLVVGFYLLIDLPRLRRSALRLVPPRSRDEAVEVLSAVGRAMGGFFRGQLLVALIVGIMSATALRLIGLPYWLVIGMIAGFFNLIPLIGPYVGAIPAVIVAAALRPPTTILWVAVALTIVQQIDNHFISPNVMRWTVRLHPVTVMLSLIIGATLLGFWGMLLAVPAVAAGKVIAAHFWRTRVPWGHEVFEEEPPPGTKDQAAPYEKRDTAEASDEVPSEMPRPAEPGPRTAPLARPTADDEPGERSSYPPPAGEESGVHRSP